MAWIALVIAGVLETIWAVAMKQSHGFTKPGPTVLMIVTMAASFGLLAWAMRSLPLGTAYAVWTGIGIIGAVAFGILLFGESASPARLACVAMILSGIIGLKLITPS